MDYTLYLSSKEPSVNKTFDYKNTSISFDNTLQSYIIYIGKTKTDLQYEATINMLSATSDYIIAIWDKGDNTISWERTTQEYSGEITNYYPFITFKYYNPSDMYTPNPYWIKTYLKCRNATEIEGYANFIIMTMYGDPDVQLLLPDGQNTKIWQHKVTQGQREVTSTYNFYCPGEYIELSWIMSTNRIYQSLIKNMPYETPLFTGGQIISKEGSGSNKTYTVKIFDMTISNIIPTDNYDYQIGKWCYLIKVDAQLNNGQQSYGSNDIITFSVNNKTNELLNLINEVRANAGLNKLVLNNYLETAANNHAEDMSINKYFSHINLDEKSSFDRIVEAGYLTNATNNIIYLVGENIARMPQTTKLDQLVEDWLNSPAHQANILNSTYTETGLGISEIRDDNIYYVQTFGYRSDITNVSMKSPYRLSPYNFKEGMTNNMAITYNNALTMEMSNNFEKVFDMIKYDGKIIEIYNQNDTAKVSFQVDNQTKILTLPIFYHCTGQPTVIGGSKAFKVDDDVYIMHPFNDTSYSDTYIVAIKDKIRKCGYVAVLSLYIEGITKYVFIDLSTKLLYNIYDSKGEKISQPYVGDLSEIIAINKLEINFTRSLSNRLDYTSTAPEETREDNNKRTTESSGLLCNTAPCNNNGSMFLCKACVEYIQNTLIYDYYNKEQTYVEYLTSKPKTLIRESIKEQQGFRKNTSTGRFSISVANCCPYLEFQHNPYGFLELYDYYISYTNVKYTRYYILDSTNNNICQDHYIKMLDKYTEHYYLYYTGGYFPPVIPTISNKSCEAEIYDISNSLRGNITSESGTISTNTSLTRGQVFNDYNFAYIDTASAIIYNFTTDTTISIKDVAIYCDLHYNIDDNLSSIDISKYDTINYTSILSFFNLSNVGLKNMIKQDYNTWQNYRFNLIGIYQ